MILFTIQVQLVFKLKSYLNGHIYCFVSIANFVVLCIAKRFQKQNEIINYNCLYTIQVFGKNAKNMTSLAFIM